jgi:hypothetical protein
MKNLRISIVCLAIFVASCASMFAAPESATAGAKATEKAKPPEKQEGRYLFLIETSQAMEGDKTALRKSMRSIIESGLDGQMKYGDTVGVWTYNDKLNTDFPMILWRNEHVKDVENAVDYWMSKQKFGHRSDISKAMPLLQNIIKASQKLTIIWMTTGNDKMAGMPFATEIDELQKEFRDDFRKQHIPFVTLLAVRKGVIADFTVNPGDAKLRLPELMEKENVPVVETNPAPAVVVAPAPVAKKPPLIIHVGPSPELVLQKSNAAIAALKAAQSNAAVSQQITTNAAAQPATATNAAVATNKVGTTAAAVQSPTATSSPAGKSNAVPSAVIATSAPVAVVTKTNAATNAVVANATRTSNVSAVATSTTTNTPAPAAVPPPRSNTILIAAGAGALMLLAGLGILFAVKKSNAPKGPSFISQSMTRERLNSDASKPSSDNPAAPE